jgi:cyclophilin family peptidyl-prolyl cis-trans isomerase
MRRSSLINPVAIFLLAVAFSGTPRIADATIVEFQTVMGNFQVNLFDNATPATVTNFLNYVNNGAYTNSVFHRSVPNFIVQGGGFSYDQGPNMEGIPTNPAVINEPEYSNVRGTISMAKLGGNPNSATNQWFFNLANNSANLDAQNGGFTVFGQVVGNGMDVIDAIAALPVFAFNSPFGELPLSNYTTTDYANNVPVDDSHLVIVTAVIVTDTTVNSAAGLNPVRNTSVGGGGGSSGDSGGGGSFGLITLLLLSIAASGGMFGLGSARKKLHA